MQFIDLKAQYQALKAEINENIQAVLDDGRYIGGPQVKQLEEKLASFVGRKHCISCANGTDALQIAFMVYGIGEGDAGRLAIIDDVFDDTPFIFLSGGKSGRIHRIAPYSQLSNNYIKFFDNGK